MFCTNCGCQIDNDSNFCIHCGFSIKNVEVVKKEETFTKDEPDFFDKKLTQEDKTIPEKRNAQSQEAISRFQVSREKAKITNRIIVYDETYKIDTTPTLVGVLIIAIIVILYFNNLRNSTDYLGYQDDTQFQEIQNFFSTFFFMIRIPIVFWVVKIAEQKNRNSASWGIWSFFFPAIVLIILGQKKKLKYKV